MPAKRYKERIAGTYFVWLLGRRCEVYYADGRSNAPSIGRHSLGTKDRGEALQALQQLDLVQAVKQGRAKAALLSPATPARLSLAEGRRLYLQHVNRPRVVGGARPASAKRYRAVFDKFDSFAVSEGITGWDQVTRGVLEGYAAHLDDAGYAYATEYLELTALKQTVKWLVEQGRLPASCLIRLPLSKPKGTTTYCWRPEEVHALVLHCHQSPDLDWLAGVLTALACTGLRISELASLRWTDIDFANNLISLTDETGRSPATGQPARQTKSGRGRAFPIHAELRGVLESLPRSKDGLVFHGPRGGRLKPDTVRQVLIRAVLKPLGERLAIPVGQGGFATGRLHSFRHYFCSTCANSGVPEQVVMEWLGHADSAMVKHYYHLHDEEAQRQMRRVRFIGAGAGGQGVEGIQEVEGCVDPISVKGPQSR